jgi:biopolymer transport protein ExbB
MACVGERWRTLPVVLLLALAPAVSAQETGEATEYEQAAAVERTSDELASESLVAVPKARSLEELLRLVEQGFETERGENREREEEFKRRRNDQEQLLNDSLAKRMRLEALSQQLESAYAENEMAIGADQARLSEQLGQMGELFGVVRQVANDLSGHTWESITNSQLGSRKELLDRLGRSKELPSTDDLRRLWFELHREMTQQGRVVRYRAEVLGLDGQPVEREVIRAGVFSAVSEGRYLAWESRDQQLRELSRQPAGKYLETVAPFEAASSGFAALALDPSQGSLLAALIEAPNPVERVQQGGAVGYVIIGLGLLALALGVVKWVLVSITSRRVAAQRKQIETPNLGNPLGRVLSVYEKNATADAETLELKLDEAVLRETSQLERFLWLVKTVSVVAPLLGLLGTVTGMIQTFQAITLFGAGDPKMMAGGISEALVTTMLGLITAIPLVLLHATLANSTRRITDVLDEQSAGLIAIRSENADD